MSIDQALKDRIKKATSIKAGNTINPNTKGYVVVKGFRRNNGHKGDFIFLELEIESATGQSADELFPEGQPNKPQEDVAVGFKLDGDREKSDMAYNNLFTALTAISQGVDLSEGQPPGEVDGAMMLEQALAPDQPLRGVRLEYTSRNKRTKAGKVGSFQVLKPCTGNTEAEVSSRRGELDKRKPLVK